MRKSLGAMSFQQDHLSFKLRKIYFTSGCGNLINLMFSTHCNINNGKIIWDDYIKQFVYDVPVGLYSYRDSNGYYFFSVYIVPDDHDTTMASVYFNQQLQQVRLSFFLYY